MSKKRLLLAWLLMCHLGNFADVILTLQAIKGGAEELNPIMNWALSVSPVFFIVAKFVVFSLAIDYVAVKLPALLRWVAILYMSVMAWHLSFL